MGNGALASRTEASLSKGHDKSHRKPHATAPILDSTCAAKGEVIQQMRVLSWELATHPGSYGSGVVGQPPCRSLPDKSSLRASCESSGRNRVNSMKAPKGCCGCRPAPDAGKAAERAGAIARRSRAVHRGSGDGTVRRTTSQRGRSSSAEMDDLQSRLGREPILEVGGAHSTAEGRETGWREGALVSRCFGRRRGSGRLT